MRRFVPFSARMVPLLQDDVDTDQIVPKQFLKRVGRTGLGEAVFFDRREERSGRPFPIGDPKYRSAAILLAGANFGCGSSREHAVWALQEIGFRAVVAASFSDIFRTNASKNGLLAAEVGEAAVRSLAARALTWPAYHVRIDLAAQSIRGEDGFGARFRVPEFEKRCMLEGLDEVEMTLQGEARISEHERKVGRSWRAAPIEAEEVLPVAR